MADKTVTYRLLADITQFKAQMAQAATSTKAAADRMTAATKEGVAFRNTLSTVGKVSAGVGLVAGAGLAVAIRAAANFDQGMSRVAAATHESAGNMELLRAAALKAGADTVFSATESATAIEAMAKAGVSTKDILAGGLTGALNLAAAGTIDVSKAADIAATTMNQFGLAGSDVGHIADVLAASAGKAQGEVTDMADALQYVGPVAAQMGISLEQTAGSIAELASQGILGSQAGTALRGMLTALTSPSKIAATTMKQLGINMYDAQGQFVGLDGIAGQLHKTMGDLTNAERDQALGRIFGNEQITAARILYSGGASAVKQWTASVNDSGYAAETAATKMDNLKGDLEQFKGSLATALIGTGEGSQSAVRGIVQDLTSVVNTYNKLPDAAHSATASALGVTAALGGGIWVFSKAVTGAANLRTALTDLGPAGTRAAGGLRAVATAAIAFEAINIGVDVINSISHSADEAAPSIDRLTRNFEDLSKAASQARGLGNITDELGNLGGKIDDATSAEGKLDTAVTGTLHKIPLIGSTGAAAFDLLSTQAGHSLAPLREAQATFDSLDASLMALSTSQGPKAARKAFEDLARSYNLTADQQQNLIAQLPQFAGVLADTAHSGFGLSRLLGSIVPDFKATGTAATGAARGVQTFQGALSELNGLLDKRDAFRNYEAALDDFRKSFKRGAGFNLDVDPGRQNQQKLDAIAASASVVASHLHGLARTEFVNHAIAQLRSMAKTMDLPKAQVDTLIAGLRTLNHSDAHPKVGVEGVPTALAGVNQLRYAIDALHSKTVVVHVAHTSSGGSSVYSSTSADGNLYEFASGGYLPKIGDQHPQVRPYSGPAGLTWSEEGSGPWEAFISGHPAKVDRSRAIAQDVVGRLGGTVQFAAGGVYGQQAGPLSVTAAVSLSEDQFKRLEAATERGTAKGAAKGMDRNHKAAYAGTRLGI